MQPLPSEVHFGVDLTSSLPGLVLSTFLCFEGSLSLLPSISARVEPQHLSKNLTDGDLVASQIMLSISWSLLFMVDSFVYWMKSGVSTAILEPSSSS